MAWISRDQLAPPPAQVIGWQQFSIPSGELRNPSCSSFHPSHLLRLDEAATAKASSVQTTLPPTFSVPSDNISDGMSRLKRVSTLDVLCGISPSSQSHRRIFRTEAKASERVTMKRASSPTFSQSSSDTTEVFAATQQLTPKSAPLDTGLADDAPHNLLCPGQDLPPASECFDYPVLLPIRKAGILGDLESVESPADPNKVRAVKESVQDSKGLLIDLSEPSVIPCAPADPFDGVEHLSNYGKTPNSSSPIEIVSTPVNNVSSPIESVSSPIENDSSPIESASSATSLSSLLRPREDPFTADEKTIGEYEYSASPTQLTDFGPSNLPTNGYHGPKELDSPFHHLFGNPHFESSSQLPEDLSYDVSPTNPSPLLELPGEVRCLVYRHLFTCGARVNLQRPGCWFYLFKQPMFYVNKQVRLETLSLLYHETYFEFDPVADATISSAFMLPYLQQIKHLTINCWQSNQGFLAGSILYFVGLEVELQTLEVRFMSSGVSVPKIFREDSAVGKALAKVKVAERTVFYFGGKVGDHFGDTNAFRTLKEVLAPGKEWSRAVSIKKGFWMRETQSTSWSVEL